MVRYRTTCHGEVSNHPELVEGPPLYHAIDTKWGFVLVS